MNKFNVMKILEKQKKEKELLHKDLEKEEYLKKVYSFIDDYVKPLLEKTTNNITYGFTDDFDTFILSKKVEDLLIYTIKILGLIGNNMFNDIEEHQLLQNALLNEEIGFLNKDKKIKKQVATKLCGYITKRLSYEDNLNNYVDEYIKPMFIKLGKENKIVFDLNSKDENKLLISNNTIELSKLGVCENTIISLVFPFTKNNYDENTLRHLDFLFNNDTEIKQEFADYLVNTFVERYNEIDFINVKKFNLINILKE